MLVGDLGVGRVIARPFIGRITSYNVCYTKLLRELLIGLYDSSQNIIAAAEYNMASDGSAARILIEDVPVGTYYIVVLQAPTFQYLFVNEP